MTPSCRVANDPRIRRIALRLAAVAALLLPLLGSAQEAPSGELVAEALFLCDTLPPGGRDVNVSVVVEEGQPDPLTGEAVAVAFPRLQLALALTDRIGFTADVGFGAAGGASLDAPGASLKVLLRSPEGGRTGLSAAVDLFGSTHSLAETEAGLGLGAIRAVGPVALRASASAATGLRTWSPHLHGGFSAAIALGSRWRALAEVVADVGPGVQAFSAGPTLKVDLAERTAFMAGALFPLSPASSPPVFAFQITQSM